MDLITPELNGSRLTTLSDNTHYLILISPNSMRADALYNGLGNNVILAYLEKDNPAKFYLSVEISDTQKYFTIEVDKDRETANWLDWIDEHKVTHVSVVYPDKNGDFLTYGQPIRLFP